MQKSLERNIAIYPWYQAASGFLPWMPVFFLFFSDNVSLTSAIELGAIYYLSVVFFEIPSGYLSDRLGRRITLMTAASFAICAYVVYLNASSFQALAIAQTLLAGAIAFQSGSDNSILYDSLVALKREDQYATHESRSQQYNLLSLSVSVLLGGLLGTLNLRLPYLAALIVAFIALYLSYSFREPDRLDNSTTKSFLPQLLSTVALAKNSLLRWIFAFYVLSYALQHVPYEFYQPYIALLKDGAFTQLLKADSSALISGVVIGISMFCGALGARASLPMTDKFGAARILIGSVLAQCIIIAGLGLWLHPSLLILIMFRNFSMALAHAPMHALIAPRVPSGQRATYLSMQSLAGRLAFSTVLFLIANTTAHGQQLNWPTLSTILLSCAVVGFAALLLLIMAGRLNTILFPKHENESTET